MAEGGSYPHERRGLIAFFFCYVFLTKKVEDYLSEHLSTTRAHFYLPKLKYIRVCKQEKEYMQLPYFYEPLLQQDDVFYTLSENTSKHCAQVLRMQNDSPLLLTDGKGLLAKAILTAPHKSKSQVKIEHIERQEPNTHKRCIAIGLLKNGARFDWFLEKATELGITEIIPMITEHTEKNHFRQDRATAVLAAAMIQSQQTYLPILHEPTTYSIVAEQSQYEQKLIAHCEDNPKTELSEITIQNDVQLLVGPEGDFSSEEILLAEKNGFVPVSLGTNRLRTETAAIAGAVLLTLHSTKIL